jgi:hypothetical protein
MKNGLKILSVCLLLLNGVAAIFGGGNLIDRPDGSSLSLSMDWLKYSPFHNYLIPGIILLIANGLSSLLILGAILIDYRKYPVLIIGQGVILTGWIVIQVLMIRTVVGLHLLMGVVGLVLILSGWRLLNYAGSEDTGQEMSFGAE